MLLNKLLADLEYDITMYSADVKKGSYVANLDEFKKKYDEKFTNDDLEINKTKDRINNLNKLIEILPKNTSDLGIVIGDLKYSDIINEQGRLFLKVRELENKSILDKKYYNSIKEINGEILVKLDKHEQRLIEKYNSIVTKINVLIIEENNRKKEELVVIEESKLIKEKSWKIISIKIIILGLTVTYLLIFMLEILRVFINKKKIEKKNNI